MLSCVLGKLLNEVCKDWKDIIVPLSWSVDLLITSRWRERHVPMSKFQQHDWCSLGHGLCRVQNMFNWRVQGCKWMKGWCPRRRRTILCSSSPFTLQLGLYRRGNRQRKQQFASENSMITSLTHSIMNNFTAVERFQPHGRLFFLKQFRSHNSHR